MPEHPHHEESRARFKEAEARLDVAKTEYAALLAEVREIGDPVKHPELWEEASSDYQAERKKQIKAALAVEDFKTAQKFIKELKEHLEKNAVWRAEHTPLTIETPEDRFHDGVDPERRREVAAAISEQTWNTELHSALKSDQPNFERLATLRAFDPVRFDRSVESVDKLWEQLVAFLERSRTMPEYQVIAAAQLRRFNPERFEREVTISEDEWKLAADKLWKYVKSVPTAFFRDARIFHEAAPDMFQKFFTSDSRYAKLWKKYFDETKKYGLNPRLFAVDQELGVARALLPLNEIRPDGEPEFTLSPEAWEKYKAQILPGGSQARDWEYVRYALRVKVK